MGKKYSLLTRNPLFKINFMRGCEIFKTKEGISEIVVSFMKVS